MSREFVRGLVLLVLVPVLTLGAIRIIHWFDAVYYMAPLGVIILVNCSVLIGAAVLVKFILPLLGFAADSQDGGLWLLVFILGAITYRMWGLDSSVRRYDSQKWDKPYYAK
jgi:hypothetical protein